DVEEDVTFKILDRGVKVSRSEILRRLKRANLIRYGYKREISTNRRIENNKSEFKKSIFYYKKGNCSEILAIERQLRQLIFRGRLGKGIHNRLSTEVKNNPHLLKNGSQCKSGLEIDFVRVTRERSLLNRRYSGESLKQFDPSDDTKTTHSFTINLGF
ncbi:unnamed protein product, partial [Porites evermanni]